MRASVEIIETVAPHDFGLKDNAIWWWLMCRAAAQGVGGVHLKPNGDSLRRGWQMRIASTDFAPSGFSITPRRAARLYHLFAAEF